MKITLDKKRKYFLLCMALLLMGGLIYRIWPQIESIQVSDGSEIDIKKKQLIKYHKMVRSGGALEKEADLLRQRLKKAESGLLTGKTTALAAADIQKVVREMAEKCGVEIKTVRVLKPEKVVEDYYIRIPLQLTISSSVRHLKEFLYLMMNSPKYLTVQKVGISVRRTRLRRKSRKVTESVRADITVNGYLKNAAESVQ